MAPTVLFCHADEEREYTARLVALLADLVGGRLRVLSLADLLASEARDRMFVSHRRARIDAAMTEHDCLLLVAVIGPGWLRSLTGAPASEEDPDLLRLALGRARELEIPVCPVCVDGHPVAYNLPEDLGFLADLAALNGRDPDQVARHVHLRVRLDLAQWPARPDLALPPDFHLSSEENIATRGSAAPPPDRAGAERDGVHVGHSKDGSRAPGTTMPAPATPAPAPAETGQPNLAYDDNVQFTVYRPASLCAGSWQTMLAFAHLGEARDDGGPDPLGEVSRQAEAVLGDAMADFRALVSDAATAIPRQSEISFVPAVPGVDFNPRRRSFRWQEDVHREEFRLRAVPDWVGSTARGHLAVFLGAILLAEVPLSMRVTGPESTRPRPKPASARPYRRIFASYSHADGSIVEAFHAHAEALGDDFLQDVLALRAGERWSERLLGLIESADVFQLFWSWNALASPYVESEWRHALALQRPNFVRPCYWERPLPRRDGTPPAELRELHFHFLGDYRDLAATFRVNERTAIPDIAAGGSSAPRPSPETDDRTGWPPPSAGRRDPGVGGSSGTSPRPRVQDGTRLADPGRVAAETPPGREQRRQEQRPRAGGWPRRLRRPLALATGYVVLVAGIVALIAVLGALFE